MVRELENLSLIMNLQVQFLLKDFSIACSYGMLEHAGSFLSAGRLSI